jgi:hypothetical protein
MPLGCARTRLSFGIAISAIGRREIRRAMFVLVGAPGGRACVTRINIGSPHRSITSAKAVKRSIVSPKARNRWQFPCVASGSDSSKFGPAEDRGPAQDVHVYLQLVIGQFARDTRRGLRAGARHRSPLCSTDHRSSKNARRRRLHAGSTLRAGVRLNIGIPIGRPLLHRSARSRGLVPGSFGRGPDAVVQLGRRLASGRQL